MHLWEGGQGVWEPGSEGLGTGIKMGGSSESSGWEWGLQRAGTGSAENEREMGVKFEG